MAKSKLRTTFIKAHVYLASAGTCHCSSPPRVCGVCGGEHTLRYHCPSNKVKTAIEPGEHRRLCVPRGQAGLRMDRAAKRCGVDVGCLTRCAICVTSRERIGPLFDSDTNTGIQSHTHTHTHTPQPALAVEERDTFTRLICSFLSSCRLCGLSLPLSLFLSLSLTPPPLLPH